MTTRWETMLAAIKRWTSPATTSPAPTDEAWPVVVVEPYTDEHEAEVVEVRQALARARVALAGEERHWSALRGDDPETFQRRAVSAPRLIALRAEVASLTQTEATLTATIQGTAALAAEHARAIAEAERFIAPILDAIPDDETLARAYAISRNLDKLSAQLLARSGDRCFRRSPVDPFGILKETLTAALHTLDKQRLLHRHLGVDVREMKAG